MNLGLVTQPLRVIRKCCCFRHGLNVHLLLLWYQYLVFATIPLPVVWLSLLEDSLASTHFSSSLRLPSKVCISFPLSHLLSSFCGSTLSYLPKTVHSFSSVCAAVVCSKPVSLSYISRTLSSASLWLKLRPLNSGVWVLITADSRHNVRGSLTSLYLQ